MVGECDGGWSVCAVACAGGLAIAPAVDALGLHRFEANIQLGSHLLQKIEDLT
ncbi:MAG: hypothetical protein F6K30_14460 [Cyanothece sp. SIO2G6]|nr:hypothetical protein [Cyanothece sp. SIO2G6]